jgi:hypothetical protein
LKTVSLLLLSISITHVSNSALFIKLNWPDRYKEVVIQRTEVCAKRNWNPEFFE